MAKEPVSTVQETAPGMGLKFLRDGMHSANLVAMYSVNGQESWNFFKNDFTTHIGKADLDLIPLILKFSEATNYVMEVQRWSFIFNWNIHKSLTFKNQYVNQIYMADGIYVTCINSNLLV